MAKQRIRPNFYQIFAKGDDKKSCILWSQTKDNAALWEKASALVHKHGTPMQVFGIYKNPPNVKGLDQYELLDTIYGVSVPSQPVKDAALGRSLMGGASLIDAETLGRIFREHGKKLAERAVWAALQDEIVQLDMVDDLEAHVEKAVGIAFRTKDNDEAIDEAIGGK